MDPQKHTADILLHPGWIVPVVPHGAVLKEHSIALMEIAFLLCCHVMKLSPLMRSMYSNCPDR